MVQGCEIYGELPELSGREPGTVTSRSVGPRLERCRDDRVWARLGPRDVAGL